MFKQSTSQKPEAVTRHEINSCDSDTRFVDLGLPKRAAAVRAQRRIKHWISHISDSSDNEDDVD